MQQQQQKNPPKRNKSHFFSHTSVYVCVCVCVCAWWSEVGSKNAFIGTCSNQTSRKHSHARLTKLTTPTQKKKRTRAPNLAPTLLYVYVAGRWKVKPCWLISFKAWRFGLCSCFPVLLFVEKILMTSFRHDPCHLFDACFFFFGI